MAAQSHPWRKSSAWPSWARAAFIKDPISAISFGMALMFGTLGLPHILMRFFTVPDAKSTQERVLGHDLDRLLHVLIFIIGFGAITLVLTNPEMADTAKGVIHGSAGTANMAAVLVAKTVGGDVFCGHLGRGLCPMILAIGRRSDPVRRLGRLARPYRHRHQEGQGRQRLRNSRSRASPRCAWALPSPCCWALCSKGRTSPSWSRWPLPWRLRPTSPPLLLSRAVEELHHQRAVIGGFMGLGLPPWV